MNDKITITWIENDYFQTKWDKFKKEMPKEFDLNFVKDKDEEIKQYRNWFENLKRKREVKCIQKDIIKQNIIIKKEESKRTLPQL